RPHEVVPQPGVLLRRKVEGVHGPPHLGQPRVPLDRPDPERRVPHPQPRVASALRVRVGSTPVLHEEQGQPLRGRAQVLLRVQRPEHEVGGDAGVELVDQRPEGRLAADEVVERACLGHGESGAHRSMVPASAGRSAGRRPDTCAASGRRPSGGTGTSVPGRGGAPTVASTAGSRSSAARLARSDSAIARLKNSSGGQRSARTPMSSTPAALQNPTTWCSGISSVSRPDPSTATPWLIRTPEFITPNARARYPCRRIWTNKPLRVGMIPATMNPQTLAMTTTPTSPGSARAGTSDSGAATAKTGTSRRRRLG